MFIKNVKEIKLNVKQKKLKLIMNNNLHING